MTLKILPIYQKILEKTGCETFYRLAKKIKFSPETLYCIGQNKRRPNLKTAELLIEKLSPFIILNLKDLKPIMPKSRQQVLADYKHKNKEKIKKAAQEHHKKNAAERSVKALKWHQDNPERSRELKNNYFLKNAVQATTGMERKQIAFNLGLIKVDFYEVHFGALAKCDSK